MGAVVLAAMLAWLMYRLWGAKPYVSLLICAVMVSAWQGGFGPGALALILSTFVFKYFFLPPDYPETSSLPRLIFFIVAGMLVGSLAATQRRTTESLRRAHAELTAKMEALRRSEAYLAAAQRLSHTGCFDWMIATGEVLWSEETYHIMQYEPATKVTLNNFLRRIHPDDLALVQQTLDIARTGNDYSMEHRIRLPDGSVKHVQIMGRVSRNEAGELVSVGAVMDVTGRHRTQNALQKAQGELAHMTRVTTLGELTVSIAHEVNQPLAAVVSNANACLRLVPRDAPALAEVREALAEIIDDAGRAGMVIARIRQLARKTPTERMRLDLREVIADVLALARYELVSRQTTIRTELPPELPPVYGDRVQLQQVLLNLVMNGMEAMAGVAAAKRSLVIRARRELREGRAAVSVSVQDAGPGLTAAEMGRLFETFYTTKAQGLGMGLAISRSIIEAHGGRLWAESSEGSGAVFSFCLPAAEAGL